MPLYIAESTSHGLSAIAESLVLVSKCYVGLHRSHYENL